MAKNDDTTETKSRPRKSAAQKAQEALDKVIKEQATLSARRDKAEAQVWKAQDEVTRLDNELAAISARYDYVSRNPDLPAQEPAVGEGQTSL